MESACVRESDPEFDYLWEVANINHEKNNFVRAREFSE
jgi:hypothetical protein